VLHSLVADSRGGLRKSHFVLAELAQQWGATPIKLARAWLLQHAPVMLPIPGTSIIAHLEENLAAASVHLSDAQFEALTNRVG
jgi:pyridoxine 4-dehydrogenase